jgi:hypothetical protein
MIRNEESYKNQLQNVSQMRERFNTQAEALKTQGMSDDEITTLMEPQQAILAGLDEEILAYEKAKNGDVEPMNNLAGIGYFLIILRIASGMTEADLASKLGITEEEVMQRERNDYHGITVSEADKIINATGAKIVSEINLPSRTLGP